MSNDTEPVTAAAEDASSNVYVASGYTIRKYNSREVLTWTLALNYEPTGLAFDSAGNLCVADPESNLIHKLDPLSANERMTAPLDGVVGKLVFA